jgi:predicted dithiol-disulfide oxidoreductase (DUF899 family)
LLKAEKEFTHLRDEVTQKRLALPWVRMDEEYVFDTLDGPRTLAELFDGRSQLLVQHFMFAPGWKEGCPSCSFMADHTDGMNLHLSHHDVTVVAVSRATLAEIERYRSRMGWKFRWVSSHDNSFNHDFRVSFTPEQVAAGQVDYNFGTSDETDEEFPGISTFFMDEAGAVFHTYSTFGRGVEVMMGTYAMLDLMPKGRNETEGMGDWMRRHDRYE